MRNLFSSLATVLFLPILLPQAVWARRRIPRLPEASGPTCGTVAGVGQPFDLIALGESTVAGVGAPTHAVALTGQTAKALAQQTGRPVHWLAMGRNGATARSVWQTFLPRLAGKHADGVIIALGVNDVIRLHSSSRWSAEMGALIAGVRQQVGPAAIVLAGVPPLDQFPALPNPLRRILGLHAKALDQGLAGLAERGLRVVHAPTRVRNEADFAPDGFHPGPVGYAAWGQQLAYSLASLLF